MGFSEALLSGDLEEDGEAVAEMLGPLDLEARAEGDMETVADVDCVGLGEEEGIAREGEPLNVVEGLPEPVLPILALGKPLPHSDVLRLAKGEAVPAPGLRDAATEPLPGPLLSVIATLLLPL